MDLDLSSYFSQATRTYNNPSQIARKVTETWARDNLYCPRCGYPLEPYKDNTKVYDFYCDHSDQRFLLASTSIDDFQLKSTKSFPYNYFPSKLIGAEYYTTIRSLEEGVFPSLILLHYDRAEMEVQDGLFIHRLSVTRNSINQRKPLSERAVRRNWVGAEILLNNIPEIGKIDMIHESRIIPKETVMSGWTSVERVFKGDLENRGWISDVMLVVDELPEVFSLDDIYSYTSRLGERHPNNMHVKDKIRQQLQVLRDQGYLKFVSRGKYQRMGH